MKENQHVKVIKNALSFMVPLRMEAYSEIRDASAALAARIEELESLNEIKNDLITKYQVENGEMAHTISILESDLKGLAFAANGLKGKIRELEAAADKPGKGWEMEFIKKFQQSSGLIFIISSKENKEG